MKNIEAKISPLIQNLFPAFYKDEGENFITFVKAYYEWLEQNHQLLELEDPTDFNVGDTVEQDGITGTIISYLDEVSILVLVDGLETFKCFNVCDVLQPITSSSGGSTYIAKGGTTLRLGTNFLARNLFNIRDIDKTLDLFIIHFKEKYLKNIEFDISTNKELLVKNSLDLYRSKGTERSIDLFFRLIYGVSAHVYYPGDDIFKLSDGQWVKPQYIEISPASEQRAVSFVGKQITGVTSNSTAFVERYVKRKIKNGWVHILYVTNIKGEFINRELLRTDKVYPDCPKMVGSLNSVEIVTGSRLFNVGDIVSFNSDRGDYGLARVSSISNKTGVVDFILIDGGWGYTVSDDSSFSESELAKRTQSIVSEKVLTLNAVETSNTVDYVLVNIGGTGYNNTDVIKAVSVWGANAVGSPTTNATGGITEIVFSNTGSGFYDATANLTISNSSGGATSGTTANLVAYTKAPTSYFKYFEEFRQQKATIVYGSATNNQLIAAGGGIVGPGGISGFVETNTPDTLPNANGSMDVVFYNFVPVSTGTVLTFDNGHTANIVSIANTSASGIVMGTPNTATFSLISAVGTIARNDELYQIDSANTEVANAIVTSSGLTSTTGAIDVSNLHGVFQRFGEVKVRGSSTTAVLQSARMSVGLYQVNGNFSNTSANSGQFYAPGTSLERGTYGPIISIGAGSGASFKVGDIAHSESLYLNTDRLAGNNSPSVGANQSFMSIRLNANSYGFPKNPAGNSASIIFSCLNFDSFVVGSIASLTSINPGAEYNVDPYVLAYQPYIAGFGLKDYVIGITSGQGDFASDEIIDQADATANEYELVVASAVGYVVGEKVYQGTIGTETATGTVVSIVSNTIRVKNTTGTFLTATALKSYISAGLNSVVSTVTLQLVIVTARAQVKSSNSSVMFAKRIQFENQFVVGQMITGGSSGATAVITSIAPDETSLPIGLNAAIQGNVATSNGSVTTLQITDSGAGYSNGEIMLYTSEDGLRSGEAKAIVSGHGTGSGYYRTSKGFLSSLSKVHDGDYYQEYSYEVLSRIPLDKYGEMFKKVMHTAGTRFFGAVLLETEAVADVEYAESNVLLSDTVYIAQFNSNSNIAANGAILLANPPSAFVDGQKVRYFTATGNTALSELANNANYYVANANTTSVKLMTSPRVMSYTFNSNTAVDSTSDFITLERHNLQDNDAVQYLVAAGNTAVTGLSNASVYHVVSSNSAGVKLAVSRGGAAIGITSSTSQNGHTLIISAINITANGTASGAATNGHYIAQVNEN